MKHISRLCEHTRLVCVSLYVVEKIFCICYICQCSFCVWCVFSRQLKGVLSSREREIASLRRQLDQSQEELSSVSRDREIALRENRRLQDDLVTMTRENQVYTQTP